MRFFIGLLFCELLFPGIRNLSIVGELRTTQEAALGAVNGRKSGCRGRLGRTLIEVVLLPVDNRIGRLSAQRGTTAEEIRDGLQEFAVIEDVRGNALERRATLEHARKARQLDRIDEGFVPDLFKRRTTVEQRGD